MGIVVIALVIGLIVLANRVQQQEAETFHKLFDLLLLGLNAPLFIIGVLLVFQANELRAIINLEIDSPTAVGRLGCHCQFSLNPAQSRAILTF